MKKILLLVCMLLSFNAFSQVVQKNGIIYKAHPYIDVVKKMVGFYMASDSLSLSKLFADTVTFIDIRTAKHYNLTDAKRFWKGMLPENWGLAKIQYAGTSDGLAYDDGPFTVVTTFRIILLNKITLKRTVFLVQLNDFFNKAGKISDEYFIIDAGPISLTEK